MFYDEWPNGMYGRLEIVRLYPDGTSEKVYEGKNAITYRAKTIMSRLLAGGLNPNATAADSNPSYQWGSGGSSILRVTGMAVGNGGHLLYTPASSNTTATLTKAAGTTLIVDPTGAVQADPLKPAMPNIGGGLQWGYAGQIDRETPGTTYEKVENGNVPWDGTGNIQDNELGVTEHNTTLYSETLRFPLDVTPATSLDGVSTPTNTEVQFKATLDQGLLNYTGRWGFASQQANAISEAGLIVGYVPNAGTMPAGQVYSNDGDEPKGGGAGGFDYSDGFGQSNFSDAAGSIASKETGLFGGNDTVPPVPTNGVDTFPLGSNTWNMIARKTFPATTKSAEFALVFIWTIGF